MLAKRELKHTNVTSVLLTGLIVKYRFISNGEVAICDSFKEFPTDKYQHCFFQMNMSSKNESKEGKVKEFQIIVRLKLLKCRVYCN